MIGRFRLNRLMGRVFHACSQVVTWISAVAPTTRAIATSTVATASCSPSVPVETVRERVSQEYDVAEPAHLRQLRTAVWVPREASVADEPLRPGVAHEERRDDQLQLVRKAGREELSEDLPAALDHQPPDAAGAQVLDDPAHFDRRPPSTTVA